MIAVNGKGVRNIVKPVRQTVGKHHIADWAIGGCNLHLELKLVIGVG